MFHVKRFLGGREEVGVSRETFFRGREEVDVSRETFGEERRKK